ncbi:hypothetical protein PLESTM_001241500 [Pleodorina starrii]|nr:hypothetical protein PLESTM_001241500 [Pleodorina starrii]
MAPVVKVRQFLASKAGANGSGSDAKVLTPLQRLKLQSRITTPTKATPGRVGGSTDHETTPSGAAPPAAEATAASAVDDRQGAIPQQAGQDARGEPLKLTLLQVPLLPKPEASRPAPPADPKALLQRLNHLRAAGDSLLAAAAADLPPGPSTSGAAAAPPSSPWPLRSPAATAAPHEPLSLRSSVRPAHAAAAAATPTAQARPQQQPLTPYTRPTSPYAGGAAGFGGAAAQPPPCLSPPSMAGLRQRELQETGGGFLTHFADPRDLSTPPPPSYGGRGLGGGGGGGAAASGLRGGATGAGGASATPLSVLRSMHRLQQLQRLQREGSQLVAAMDGS